MDEAFVFVSINYRLLPQAGVILAISPKFLLTGRGRELTSQGRDCHNDQQPAPTR